MFVYLYYLSIYEGWSSVSASKQDPFVFLHFLIDDVLCSDHGVSGMKIASNGCLFFNCLIGLNEAMAFDGFDLVCLCRFSSTCFVSFYHVVSTENKGESVLEDHPEIQEPFFGSLIGDDMLRGQLVSPLEVHTNAYEDHESCNAHIEFANPVVHLFAQKFFLCFISLRKGKFDRVDGQENGWNKWANRISKTGQGHVGSTKFDRTPQIVPCLVTQCGSNANSK